MNRYLKRKWIPSILICCVFLFLSGCSDNTPQEAVKRELNLIQELDETTIQAFISYENMVSGQSSSEYSKTDSTEAIKLFFKNFDYKILSSSNKGDRSIVTVEITNIDTKALALDLCKALIARNASLTGTSPDSMEDESYFTLLDDCLSNNQYELKTTTAELSVTKANEDWTLDVTENLEDALVSGFSSYIKDPYLLTPQEVLTIDLDSLKEMTPQQWLSYLNIQDLFSTGNPLYHDIDLAITEQLSENFSYNITQSTQDGNLAQVAVSVTSLDLGQILSDYTKLLLQYADNPASIRADDEEFSNQTSQYLLEAIENNHKSITNNISISMVNNGSTWVMQVNDSFTNALLGDMEKAIESFSQTDKDSPAEGFYYF